ncbi:MAG: threonine--tRNA ligase [Candidatus Pacearchaeota archaeon]
MKILLLHCDYIRFKPVKKALKDISELKNEEKKGKEVKETLVVLTAVEKTDEENEEEILNLYIKNIEEVIKQIKVKNVVIYPYAHLSSNLANSSFAQNILIEAEKKLSKKYNVVRAPFGYYKEFELKCKGHPLAELSREIKISKDIKENEEKKQEKIVEEKYDYKQLLNQISKCKLDTSRLKDNDHRLIGQRLNLFSFNECAPGMVFFHNNGLIIYNELLNYWREEHKKEGYKEISTPLILDKRLWQISGHWEKYRENIFLTKYEGRDFAVKPMNCPGGLLVYRNTVNSYKDLPIRVAEVGIVHRQELSGVLAGLFRLIKFTQDDAHIFCKDEKQIEIEIEKIIELTERIYSKLGVSLDHIELSTRPEKRIGSDELWDKAEKILEKVLKKSKLEYRINKGEGAFYGPKIDFHIKDSLNRNWQCGTIQLDFAMPERFDIFYIDEKNERKRPIMIHRTVLGSFERFIGILLEHLNGNLPVWLSPVQVRIISCTDRNIKSVLNLEEKLKKEGIRVDIDIKSETVNNKIRNSELMKIPYVIVIGDKEEENNTIAIRKRGKNEKPEFNIRIEDFIKKIKKEIIERI